MQFFREERMRCVRQLAGNRYSTNAALKKTYVNLISLYVNIVGRNLISKNPRAMLSTFDRSQKPAVSAAETWVNKELVRMNFAANMQRLVYDALFSCGIAKVCLATPEDAAISAWGLKAGNPYIARVDLDDFVFDHRARDFDEVMFIGHRYRAPLDVVKENPRFNKKAREKLTPNTRISYNREGDERIGEIMRDYHGYDEDLYDMVELWEFYLPHEKMVKTFTEDDLTGPSSAWEGGEPIALGEQKWIGPDSGPYPILAYQIIPGNPFPKGPILDLIELHDGANEGYRKLMRQAARLKVLTTCDANSPADGQAINNANDGQGVPLSSPNAVKEMVTGGPHAGLFQWTKEVITRFMEQAGNLMTMGGLAPQAGTLGQEELLAQQSNGQLATMQDTTHAFVSKCIDSMLWYYWYHPELRMDAEVNDPMLPDVHYLRQVYPGNHPDPNVLRRTGQKPDLKIDPHTMRSMTPQQRAKDLTSIVTQIYIPLAAVAQQQGIMFDFNAFLGIMAKYMDAPDLQSIISLQTPPQNVGNSPASEPTGQQSTTHEYTRRSVGDQSSRAQKMEMDNELSAMSAMAGGNGQMNGTAH